jgi:drug/metabolite transporter (DMT)-like permease
VLTGALFGAAAAVALGVNQILMTYAARHWGTVRATFAGLFIAFLIFITFTLATDANLPVRGNDLFPLLFGIGIAAGLAYLAQLESLREGPISVVTPIGATAGAMTVFYAFVLLGERPSALQWVGIPLATAGAVAVSLDLGSGPRFKLISRGPIFAFMAVATGAISNAVLRIPVRELGTMAAIVYQRSFTVALVGIVFYLMVRRGRLTAMAAGCPAPVGPGPASFSAHDRDESLRWAWLLLVVVGFLDAAAFIFFAEGLQRADAWLIGILSQSGRVIAVVGGFVLFQERLRRHQWLGISLVVVGLVLSVTG